MKKFLSILTVLLFVFSISGNFVKAAGPAATLTTPGGGITSIAGTPATHGREAGAHSIAISDATKSYVVSDAIENPVFPNLVNVAITAANDDMTIIIGGETLVFDLAATAVDTTLAAVAADIEGKIDGALAAVPLALTVTVSVEGASPDKYLKILVDKAGASNSISSISGGAATSLLFDNAIVAGTDAKAIDTFAAATNSNGAWVLNNGSTSKTISHTTAPATESTLAGLKSAITNANDFINGITLNAAGALSAGTALVTVATGDVNSVTITTEPIKSYIYQNLNNQPVVRVWDEALNGKTADVLIKAYTSCDSGTPANFDVAADPDFIGTLTVSATNGIATFSGVKYNSINTAGILLKATAGGIANTCNTLTGFKVYSNTGQTVTTSGTTTTPTTTAPSQTTTTTTTPSPAVTTMPQPAKPIAEMNQAEKDGYVMQLQQFLITLLTQLLTLLRK